MPTQPLPKTTQVPGGIVHLKHLPAKFIAALDELLGTTKQRNGGFAAWHIDLERGLPRRFQNTEGYLAELMEVRIAADEAP